MIDKNLLNRVKKIIRADAQSKRDDAGYSGAMHDGGAGALERQLETFLCGIEQKFPDSWSGYVKAAGKEIELEQLEGDADYNTYLRLRRRFKHLE